MKSEYAPGRRRLPCFRIMALLLGVLTTSMGHGGFSSPPEVLAGQERVREAVLAGTWYPSDPIELRQQIEGFLKRVSPQNIPGSLLTLLAPHAGTVFSGQTAAHAYKLLEGRKMETVVVIAPSHHARFSGVSVYDRGGFRTPLGLVPLDEDLVSALKKRDSRIRFVPEAHAKEHAVEIQLPFLQAVMPGFKLVPLVMGDQDLSAAQWLAEAVAACIGGKSVLVVASSDLSHFHSDAEARKLDHVIVDKVNGFDPEGLSLSLREGKCEACGGGPLVATMMIARRLGATSSRVLSYATSGDVTGDRGRVVGYLAAAQWAGPPLQKPEKDAAVPAAPQKAGVDLGLSTADKALLHRLVKETIQARFKGAKALLPEASSAVLREHRGAFVTLHKHGELRGCIGMIVAEKPLIQVVSEMASAAAFQDPRFPPVTQDELKDLDYEISVLTPLRRIQDVTEIQVGVHGILLKNGARSGVLLPQVATEQRWDRGTFLEQTCRKAFLPKDAWKDGATEIYIFSADVF